ncbi:hypothetical protein PAXRUDRAFT_835984 [Paxillus rubicundulus Ve08.2h10]|uniref:Uncharacterized protein n=1 Tax=Paxillus rubicundulus Ve08.2h10 TaxID=930991 RepID=A0A0D0CTV5_9AGAM|nr:hypothetical protein PAXRUDRAFT_835984 [Paxillus rubicundulus Ve08.2h10]
MANPNLETLPNYASPESEIICEGLRRRYHEEDQQVIEHLFAAWQADRMSRIVACNVQKEVKARAVEGADQAHRL